MEPPTKASGLTPPPVDQPLHTPAETEESAFPRTGPYHSTPADKPSDPAIAMTRPEGQPPFPRPASGNLGMYQLLEELAQGGMGVVYKARHTTLDRLVALKTLRSDVVTVPELAQRFDREVRAAARLNHPHIVPVYEVGRHQDQPYYTMAYVPGGSLARQRDRYQSDPRAALALIEKVARAVHYAHEQGILHRDLKPGNVLLDERGEPQVSDFGLAKFRDADVELTQTGAVLGTPAYMAPEQAAGRSQDIGPATDVWALGVMLYELLAGRRPFLGDTGEEVKGKILTEEPPPLQVERPLLDPALEPIVQRCLAKKPSRRYSSASDLADDLTRYLRGERVTPALSWRRRCWRSLRRHPFLALGIVLAAACILVLTVAFLHRDRPKTPTAKHSVTLIGATGPPAQFHWVFGRHKATLHSTRQGDPFVLDTSATSALELLAHPPWPRYRLEAELRQDAADKGEVGLFIARSSQWTPQGEYHTLLSVGFAEVGSLRGKVRVHIWRIPQPARDSFGDVSLSWSHPFTPASRPGQPHPWRKLAIEVTPEKVLLFWEGQQIGTLTAADLQAAGQVVFAEMAGASWHFAPQNGLGIYIANGGKASFRRAVIKAIR